MRRIARAIVAVVGADEELRCRGQRDGEISDVADVAVAVGQRVVEGVGAAVAGSAGIVIIAVGIDMQGAVGPGDVEAAVAVGNTARHTADVSAVSALLVRAAGA